VAPRRVLIAKGVMENGKLKIAIIGLTDAGIELLEAAFDSELFAITAVGDKDIEAAEKVGEKYGCGFYDDFRQLIIRSELDVLIAADPPSEIDEYIRAAMQKKIHILKVSPVGAGFEQAAEYVSMARSACVRFVVANSNRFTQGFGDLRNYIKSEGVDQFHLISAVCNVRPYIEEVDQRWLSDPSLAGGGTLLYDGYEMIDQIVMNFSVPQQVYALTSNHAPDKQQRLSLTEDTAVITMRFSDTLAGNVVVSRVLGPEEWALRIHGKDKYISVTKGAFTVCDNAGGVIKELKYDRPVKEAWAGLLENLAKHILAPKEHNLFADELADLNNMAVIESAYLSARTGMPEEPCRIMDVIEIEPTSIWGAGVKRIV
jgi:predicted dehydrogenase